MVKRCVHIAESIGSIPIPPTKTNGSLTRAAICFCGHRATLHADLFLCFGIFGIMKLMAQPIIFQYIRWHYFEMPKNILNGWGNFLEFGISYFSTIELAKSLFAPWRRIQEGYEKRFAPTQWVEAFTLNMMSRIIGAVLRFCLICLGFVAEVFIFLAGLIVFLFWLLLPLIAGASVFFGIKFLL
jgi:hypothetical protein